MNPERWRRIERIFHSALERPSREREAFLEQECRGDDDLRREVQSLLDRAASAEGFLNGPAAAAAAQMIEGAAPILPRSPVPAPTQLPTESGPPGRAARVPAAETPAARILSNDSIRCFTPGTVLAGRYRVIGLLGRGGMGEVYRADDLKLGTPVALKFLPRALADDPVRRELFLSEVRIARQVAHPNVCRVFDIGETAADGGQHFLSMEYIDGEDLASLLLRIGRLPADKALDIARQICAGLAAAHDRGVLHRDLKPANVMLDGRGRVRITDFGLAVAADAAGLAWDASGTPAYMAPEQFAGKGASVRSDVYALGLVLYELYTGKRAFTASSLGELRTRKEQELPAAPSELIKDMDPSVERVIFRAIARDPGARPASVAQVAAALPGGNALEAALRAGETPSPEMVAASGTSEGLEARAAWAVLALVVAGAVAAVGVASRALFWSVPPDKSPQVLSEHARETLARLGYAEPPADRASGFEVDLEQLRYVQTHDPSRARWNNRDPSLVRFWYRESPQPLETWRFPFQYGNVSRISPVDPPLAVTAMALVRLDPTGRLMHLVVVPPQADDAMSAPAPDWAALLARAGFDPSVWKPVAPERTPPVYADARAAWEGTWPNRPDLPVRLEAAALRGRTVYFEAIYPWTRPSRPTLLTATDRIVLIPIFLTLAAMLAGAAVFARRNVRAGRGDRRGALRLSGLVFAAMSVSWFLGERHVATLWEVALLLTALSWALLAAAFCWIGYLAIEPFLRRRWPDVLVTWTRLLAGEFRDPLVGRDVLIGCAAGCLMSAWGNGSLLLPEQLGLTPPIVPADLLGVTYGVQEAVPLLVWRLAQSVMTGLAAVFFLLLLRLAMRSRRAAIVAFAVTISAFVGAGSGHFWISFATAMVLNVFFVVLIARAGLLAAVVAFYVTGLFIFFPVTGNLRAWYAGAGVTALLVLAAVALFGFTTALAGRPALGKAALDA
ncbi:MAG TPA: serine/threonine-protein kinase [Vicinamibacterales bacterium]